MKVKLLWLYKFYEITQDKLDKRNLFRFKEKPPPNLELNLKEIISEDLTGAEKGSLKNTRNKTGGDKNPEKLWMFFLWMFRKKKKGN